MSRLLILTRSNLVTGFHLAGVEAFAAEDVESAQELINGWLEDSEEGLLALDEGLLTHMEPGFVKRLGAAPHLPYLAIPGTGEQGPEFSRRHRIADMIRRAIGFHITFKGEVGANGWFQVVTTSQYTYNIGTLPAMNGNKLSFAVRVVAKLPNTITVVNNLIEIGGNETSQHTNKNTLF